jgi:hypothetical protein
MAGPARTVAVAGMVQTVSSSQLSSLNYLCIAF